MASLSGPPRVASTDAAQLTPRQVLDVLRAAHRAPSIHNTQPWLFRVLPDGVEVLDDFRRALPASDPKGRDRVVSCGAAVRNAELSVARLGRRPQTILFPHGPEEQTVAGVIAGVAEPVSDHTEDLYRAIWERRTHRRIFMASTETDDVPPAVVSAVTGTHVRLAIVPAPLRTRFAQLVWDAAQQQVVDDERRAELLRWTRRQTADDGVPARSHGNAPFPVDSLLVRTLPPEPSAPPWMMESLASGPVVVLLTEGDDRPDWLSAGIALESVLLATTAAGLVTSFLNQVVQQEAYRSSVVKLLGEVGYPQVVLRIGQPLVDVPVTPRRPLTDVTLGWPLPPLDAAPAGQLST
jgi:hypothetical protein